MAEPSTATSDENAGSDLQVDLRPRSVPASTGTTTVLVQVVTVTGEVDLTTAPLLEAVLAEACTARVAGARVVVDTATMTFCGARGLDVLHRGARLAAEHATLYALAGLSPRLARLLHDLWPAPARALYPDCAIAVGVLAHEGPRLGGEASSPQARALAEAQQRTLADRAVIEQAVGVVDQYLGLGADHALADLRAHATRHGFVLTELAGDIVYGRVDPSTVLGTAAPQQAGRN